MVSTSRYALAFSYRFRKLCTNCSISPHKRLLFELPLNASVLPTDRTEIKGPLVLYHISPEVTSQSTFREPASFTGRNQISPIWQVPKQDSAFLRPTP